MSKPYRIICTDKVHYADTVIGGKEGLVYIDDNGKPVTLLKDDVMAVLEIRERDVTGSFIRNYEDY